MEDDRWTREVLRELGKRINAEEMRALRARADRVSFASNPQHPTDADAVDLMASHMVAVLDADDSDATTIVGHFEQVAVYMRRRPKIVEKLVAETGAAIQVLNCFRRAHEVTGQLYWREFETGDAPARRSMRCVMDGVTERVRDFASRDTTGDEFGDLS